MGTGIMAGICTSPYPSSYPIEKVGDFSYPYPYPVNVGFSVKTETNWDNTHEGGFIYHLYARVRMRCVTCYHKRG